MVIQNLRPGDLYPVVTGQSLRSFDNLVDCQCSVPNGNHACNTWHKEYDEDNFSGLDEFLKYAHGNTTCPKVVTDVDGRLKMARALAYRAGIVKIDPEALTLVATEVIHHLGVLARHAADDSMIEHINITAYDPKGKLCHRWTYGDVCNEIIQHPGEEENHLREERTTRYNGDYFAKHIPPPKPDSDDHFLPPEADRFIVIPRHIKDAAIRNRMKPVLLCNKFGTYWASRKGNSVKDEVSREKARYASENIISSKDDSEEESEDEFSEDDGKHYNDGTSISYCSSISYDSDEERSYTNNNEELSA